MKKSVALFAAVALAACSHSGGKPTAKSELARVKRFVAPPTVPTTPTTATTSTTLPPASREREAIALAKRLGCTETTIGSQPKISGFPSPTQSVSCTISHIELSIDVFASHADLAKALSPGSRGVVCALASVFGVGGPQYLVVGDDFTVGAQPAASLGDGIPTGTLAQAKALSAALDLPVTTINC
jgi:hypothetical protein